VHAFEGSAKEIKKAEHGVYSIYGGKHTYASHSNFIQSIAGGIRTKWCVSAKHQ